jgi:SAM-dependent methyltransferase
MSLPFSATDWEAMFAPYDPSTYQAVLALLKPQDIVLDIGAGDLQFSRQMAQMTSKVYAVEVNALILQQGLDSSAGRTDNLIPMPADARKLDFPTGISVGVLLMRHCTHFRYYSAKLRLAGAKRLITNARWHMGVEEINLQEEGTSFNNTAMGWYACSCGAAGFKTGPIEQWSSEMDKVTHEVMDCPQCRQN